ncbi:MAG: hypothetical protein Q9210_004442 [Variospora velana]
MGEFARLYPVGSQAVKALDLLCSSEDLEEHHRHFVTVKDRTQPAGSMVLESNAGVQRISTYNNRMEAYYALSLEDPVSRPFHQGWLVGKGSALSDKQSFRDASGPPKGVDILLIRPGNKSYGVTSVHARISFHAQSGILMLHGILDDAPVEYQTHNGSGPVLLGSGQRHVLYQRTNSFTVGQLQYRLVFSTFSPESYLEFEKRRNTMMAQVGLPRPHPGLAAVWLPHVGKKGPVISYENVGHGKFGWIRGAVDCLTGNPRAIKEQQPGDRPALQSILFEMKVGDLANELPGLLPTIRSWCEHDYDTICSRYPQKVFSTSPLALSDFARVEWTDQSTGQTLDHFRGPLQGLANLHDAGYMHRDIHMKNLFLMAVSPVQAVLGDFGKATKEQQSSYPRLGPPSTCAPEIDVEGKRFYDNKIDIWSIGIAMARALVNVQRLEGRVTQVWHDDVLRELQQLARQGGQERDVADLVTAMLAWDPARRPSASTALAHPCFSSGNRRPPSSTQEPDLPHKAVSFSHQISRQPERFQQQHGHRLPSGYADSRLQHCRQGHQGFAARQVSEEVHHPEQQMQELLLPRPGEPDQPEREQPPKVFSREWYKGPSTSEEKSTSLSSRQNYTPWIPLAKYDRYMPPYNSQ